MTVGDTDINSTVTQTEAVSPAAAATLVIETQPSSTATAGVAFTTQPVVYEEDQYGNLETSDHSTVITASSRPAPARSREAPPRPFREAWRRFGGLADDLAESLSLKLAGGGLSVVTRSITVSAGPAMELIVSTQPPIPITAGQSFGLVVSADDSFDNVDTDFTGAVTVTLARRSELHHDRIGRRTGSRPLPALTVPAAPRAWRSRFRQAGSPARPPTRWT